MANGRTKPEDAALTHALRAAARGCYVVPVDAHKRPLVKWKRPDESSCSEEQIRAWAKRRECSGFAIKTGGQSHEVVLDVDAHNGGDVAALGLDLPPTLTVATPRGGRHYHFHCNGNVPTNGRLAQGLELLGDDHLAMLPGSRFVLENGAVVPYRRIGRRRSVAPLPAGLLKLAQKPSDAIERPDGAYGQGSRNVDLTALAGRLKYASATEEEMVTMLRKWNELRCQPPLSVAEVDRIAKSISQRSDATSRILVYERARQEARALLTSEALGRNYTVPEHGRTLSDALAAPREPITYTVEGLHVKGGNTLLVASYKTGKTSLVNNLIRSLADGIPFLNKYDVAFDRRVGFLQYELSAAQSLKWLEDVGIENPDRVAEPWQLRGFHLPFWVPAVRDEVVEWAIANDVGFLILDPLARAGRGLVEAEGDNVAFDRFFSALDDLKRLANIDDLLVTTHMGRFPGFEDAEHARGGTRQEDWMDHGWYMTKDDSGTRYLRAMGRDVDVPARALHYEMDSRRYSDAGYTRRDRKAGQEMEGVVDALAALQEAGDYPATATALTRKMKDVEGSRRNQVVQGAVDNGYVHRESGPNRSFLHTLTDKGRQLHERKMSRT